MLGDSLRRRRPGRVVPERRPPPRGPARGGAVGRWLRWLGFAVIVLMVSFGVGYLLSTLVLFPRPDTAGAGVAVPRLYGMDTGSADEALAAVGLEVGEVMELASLETPSGRVLAQDPVPGQQLRPGAAVSYAVSSGPPFLRVPAVVGLAVEAARELLEGAGFDVEIQEARSGEVPPGTVARTEPAGGEPQRLPARVVLVVAVGGAEPDSPVGDTVQAADPFDEGDEGDEGDGARTADTGDVRGPGPDGPPSPWR